VDKSKPDPTLFCAKKLAYFDNSNSFSLSLVNYANEETITPAELPKPDFLPVALSV